MEILKFLYYFTGIIFILYELWWLSTAETRVVETKILKEWETTHRKNGKIEMDWERIPHGIRQQIVRALLILFPFIFWLFVGLFTFNWVGYASILVINITVIPTLLKIFKDKLYFKKIILQTWGIILIVFILFAIVNSYHLHIDLFQQLKNLF